MLKRMLFHPLWRMSCFTACSMHFWVKISLFVPKSFLDQIWRYFADFGFKLVWIICLGKLNTPSDTWSCLIAFWGKKWHFLHKNLLSSYVVQFCRFYVQTCMDYSSRQLQCSWWPWSCLTAFWVKSGHFVEKLSHFYNFSSLNRESIHTCISDVSEVCHSYHKWLVTPDCILR